MEGLFVSDVLGCKIVVLHIIDIDVENSHDKDGYRYAYIGNRIIIDGGIVEIRISIKKKVGSNHFWIHNIDEI